MAREFFTMNGQNENKWEQLSRTIDSLWCASATIEVLKRVGANVDHNQRVKGRKDRKIRIIFDNIAKFPGTLKVEGSNSFNIFPGTYCFWQQIIEAVTGVKDWKTKAGIACDILGIKQDEFVYDETQIKRLKEKQAERIAQAVKTAEKIDAETRAAVSSFLEQHYEQFLKAKENNTVLKGIFDKRRISCYEYACGSILFGFVDCWIDTGIKTNNPNDNKTICLKPNMLIWFNNHLTGFHAIEFDPQTGHRKRDGMSITKGDPFFIDCMPDFKFKHDFPVNPERQQDYLILTESGLDAMEACFLTGRRAIACIHPNYLVNESFNGCDLVLLYDWDRKNEKGEFKGDEYTDKTVLLFGEDRCFDIREIIFSHDSGISDDLGEYFEEVEDIQWAREQFAGRIDANIERIKGNRKDLEFDRLHPIDIEQMIKENEQRPFDTEGVNSLFDEYYYNHPFYKGASLFKDGEPGGKGAACFMAVLGCVTNVYSQYATDLLRYKAGVQCVLLGSSGTGKTQSEKAVCKVVESAFTKGDFKHFAIKTAPCLRKEIIDSGCNVETVEGEKVYTPKECTEKVFLILGDEYGDKGILGEKNGALNELQAQKNQLFDDHYDIDGTKETGAISNIPVRVSFLNVSTYDNYVAFYSKIGKKDGIIRRELVFFASESADSTTGDEFLNATVRLLPNPNELNELKLLAGNIKQACGDEKGVLFSIFGEENRPETSQYTDIKAAFTDSIIPWFKTLGYSEEFGECVFRPMIMNYAAIFAACRYGIEGGLKCLLLCDVLAAMAVIRRTFENRLKLGQLELEFKEKTDRGMSECEIIEDIKRKLKKHGGCCRKNLISRPSLDIRKRVIKNMIENEEIKQFSDMMGNDKQPQTYVCLPDWKKPPKK